MTLGGGDPFFAFFIFLSKTNLKKKQSKKLNFNKFWGEEVLFGYYYWKKLKKKKKEKEEKEKRPMWSKFRVSRVNNSERYKEYILY